MSTVSLADLYANPELLLQRKYQTSTSSCTSSSTSSCTSSSTSSCNSSKPGTVFRSAPSSPNTLPRNQLHTHRGQQRETALHNTTVSVYRRRLWEWSLFDFREMPHATCLLQAPENTMSRGTAPPAGFLTEVDFDDVMTEEQRCSVGFSRGSRGRSSLPLPHSSPSRDRGLGVVYLQLGEDTRQVYVSSELKDMSALRALFLRTFPQISVRLLQSPHTSVCIRDHGHAHYRLLQDPRSISAQSCLKLFTRDPGPEPRISKELLYGGHMLQGSMSPPMVRSVPSSPSKAQGSSTLPRQRTQATGRKPSSSSSAILERRDVVPDEELCPELALVLHPDALPHALDPVPPMSRTSQCTAPPSVSRTSQCSAPPSVGRTSQYSAPPSLCVALQDSGALLPRFHASVKPLHSHTGATQSHSLTRRSSGGHMVGPPLDPVPAEACKGRILGSCSSNSSVFVDEPLSDDVFGRNSGSQSERMLQMEEQIASLAGLVHRALSVGEAPDLQDPGENGPRLPFRPKGVLLRPGQESLSQKLSCAKHTVCDLRLQLEQLRHQQLCQQAAVGSMLRAVGQELLTFMKQKLQSQESGPRAEVEHRRRVYSCSQQHILSQLSSLEDFVGGLQKSLGSGPGSVSLGDVELAAVSLRKIGQDMALLKGGFPGLQSRMCSVLRLEMELVRFLKEEPLQMDAMLCRIRNLTEDLSTLHRSVSESLVRSREDQVQVSPRPRPRSSFRGPENSCGPGASAASASVPVSSAQEIVRLTPDGSVAPDSDQSQSSESSDQSLTQDPGSDPETSTETTHTHHVDSGVRRPERPSKIRCSNGNTTPPQRFEVQSSGLSEHSVKPQEREKVPMSKPPRQPPEVKPKPQKSPAVPGNTSSRNSPITATAAAASACTKDQSVPQSRRVGGMTHKPPEDRS
uniref:Uncharacterized protein n=1 Tax=Knipowitschia caucasica TaxID=637954 RepID=A0AAV2JTU4_KNICA